MHKHAILADLQLDKKLYGLRETWEDWFHALKFATDTIIARQAEIEAVHFLGDIFDTEAIGGTAAHAFLSCLKSLEATGKPVFVILGNHDRAPYMDVPTWLDVMTLVNKHVIPLTFDKPYTIKGKKPLTVYGNSFMKSGELREALKSLPDPKVEHEVWMVLHQALGELSPNLTDGDLTTEDVPAWVNQVFMGDFHDQQGVEDKLGRKFMYPGAIETVSFNQKSIPGFILWDRDTKSYEHIVTQQRGYVSVNLATVAQTDWMKTAVDAVAKAQGEFGRLPVMRIFYPFGTWEAYAPVMEAVKPTVLKLFDQELNSTLEGTQAQPSISINPETRDEVRNLAIELLEPSSDSPKVDARRLLLRPENLSDIQKERFPKAVFIPKT